MPIQYATNLGRSFKYALPAVARSFLPSFTQTVESGTNNLREEIYDLYQESNSLVRDDGGILGLFRTGWNRTIEDAKSGHLFGREREIDFGDDFNFDEDGDFSDNIGDGESEGLSMPVEGPSARVTAAATETSANIQRINLATQAISLGKIRASIDATGTMLERMHNWNISRTESFYDQSLRHFSAISGLTSEISSKMNQLIEGIRVTATATDAALRFSQNRLPNSYGEVFSADGSFNAEGYIRLLRRRAQMALGEDSTFTFFFKNFVENPLEFLITQSASLLAPIKLTNTLERFDKALSAIPINLFERLNNLTENIRFNNPFLGTPLSWITNAFSYEPEYTEDPNLGQYARADEVAFDGLTQKTITEIIPSLLGDIHSEVLAMRLHMGADAAQKKVFDHRMGMFTTREAVLGERERQKESSITLGYSNLLENLSEDTDKYGLFEALEAITRSGVRLQRGQEDIFNLTSYEIERLRNLGQEEEARKVEAGTRTLNQQRNRFGERAEFDYFLNTGRQQTRGNLSELNYQSLVGDTEGAIRMALADKIGERNLFLNQEQGFTGIGGLVPGTNNKIERQAARSLMERQNRRDPFIFYGDAQEYAGGDPIQNFSDFLSRPTDAIGNATRRIERSIARAFFGPRKERVEKGSINDLFSDLDDDNIDLGDDPDISDGGGSGGGLTFGGFFRRIKGSLGRFAKGFGNILGGMLGIELKDISESGLFKSVQMKMNDIFSFIGKVLRGEDGKGGILGKIGNIFDRLYKGFDEHIWTPVKQNTLKLFNKAVDRVEKIFTPVYDFIKEKTDKLIPNLWAKFTELTMPIREKLSDFGDFLVKQGQDFFSNLRKSIWEPISKSLFDEKSGFFPRIWGFMQKRVFPPFQEAWTSFRKEMKEFFFNEEKGIFPRIRESLFGEKGAFRSIGDSIRETWSEFTSALFGTERGTSFADSLKGWISERLNQFGTWLGKVTEPLQKRINELADFSIKQIRRATSWLTDPETGLIRRFSDRLTERITKWTDYVFGETGLVGKITDRINLFLRGDGTEENPGLIKRYFIPIREFLKEEVWNPLQNSIRDTWVSAKNWLKEEFFDPIKETLDPIMKELRFFWTSLGDWFSGPFMDSIKFGFEQVGQSFSDLTTAALGKSLGTILRENVLDPIEKTLKDVRDFLGNALKSLLRIPVDILKNIADAARERQRERGERVEEETDETDEGEGRRTRGTRTRRFGFSLFRRARSETEEQAEEDRLAKEDDEGVEQRDSRRERQRQRRIRREGRRDRRRARREARGARRRGEVGGSVDEAEDAIAEEEARTAEASRVDESITPGATADTSETTARRSGLGEGLREAERRAAETDSSKPTEESEEKTIFGRRKPKSLGNRLLSEISDSTRKSADRLNSIYKFIRSNLGGVGKNVWRIAKSMGANTIDGADGDERRSLLSRVKDFVVEAITSPFKLLNRIIGPILRNIGDIIGNVAKAVTSILSLPLKLFNAFGELLDSLAETVENFGHLIGGIFRGIGHALKGLGETIYGFGSVLRGVMHNIGEAVGGFITGLGKGLGSLLDLIPKIGTAATTLITNLGLLSKSLLENIGVAVREVVRTVGTGLKEAVGIVGEALGIGRGARSQRVQKVFVVGGRLAGTEGGAETYEEGTGGGVLRRTFRAIKDRLFKQEKEEKESRWKKMLLTAQEKTTEVAGNISDSISGLWGYMMIAVPAIIKAIAAWKITGMAANLLAGLAPRRIMKSIGGLFKGGVASKVLKGTIKGGLSGWKKAGLAALVMGGALGASEALGDEYIEDPETKKSFDTGMDYAGDFATGTAVGAAAGGALSLITGGLAAPITVPAGALIGGLIYSAFGAIERNWDSIVEGFDDAFSDLIPNLNGIWSSIFGSSNKYEGMDSQEKLDAIIKEEDTTFISLIMSKINSVWKWIVGSSEDPDEEKEGTWLGRIWDSLVTGIEDLLSNTGRVIREAFNFSIIDTIVQGATWATNLWTSMKNEFTDFMGGLGTKLGNAFDYLVNDFPTQAKKWVNNIWNMTTDDWGKAIKGIGTEITTQIDYIIKEIPKDIGDWIDDFWKDFKLSIRNLFTSVKEFILGKDEREAQDERLKPSGRYLSKYGVMDISLEKLVEDEVITKEQEVELRKKGIHNSYQLMKAIFPDRDVKGSFMKKVVTIENILTDTDKGQEFYSKLQNTPEVKEAVEEVKEQEPPGSKNRKERREEEKKKTFAEKVQEEVEEKKEQPPVSIDSQITPPVPSVPLPAPIPEPQTLSANQRRAAKKGVLNKVNEALAEDLKRDEGFVPHVYKDTQGHETIGYGRLVDPDLGGGISKEEGEYLLNNDIEVKREEVKRAFPTIWGKLDSVRKKAFLNMAFNLGIPRLKKFNDMLNALREEDYDEAAEEALDSLWSRQVGARAQRVAKDLREGISSLPATAKRRELRKQNKTMGQGGRIMQKMQTAMSGILIGEKAPEVLVQASDGNMMILPTTPEDIQKMRSQMNDEQDVQNAIAALNRSRQKEVSVSAKIRDKFDSSEEVIKALHKLVEYKEKELEMMESNGENLTEAVELLKGILQATAQGITAQQLSAAITTLLPVGGEPPSHPTMRVLGGF